MLPLMLMGKFSRFRLFLYRGGIQFTELLGYSILIQFYSVFWIYCLFRDFPSEDAQINVCVHAYKNNKQIFNVAEAECELLSYVHHTI